MATSEARIAANRRNCLKSSGPSAEGKLRSRRNSIKHGLSGSGVVVPERDGDEIDRRAESLAADLDPKSPLGAILVRQLATLSVRMERGARQESEALAGRVRHAAEAFDEARIEAVKRLFEGLADDPREAVRKLRKTPEGVDRLVLAWRDLRSALTSRYYPGWDEAEFKVAARLLGLVVNPSDSVAGKLSRACSGRFTGLEAEPGSDLEPAARKAWALERLHEFVDAEIAGLTAHRATLDFETIALDRAGAADLALFDSSKDAILARRYEADARRGFFKSLEKFREVEAEVVVQEDVAVESPAPPPAEGAAPLASFREQPAATARSSVMALPVAEGPPVDAPRGPGIGPRAVGRAALVPG